MLEVLSLNDDSIISRPGNSIGVGCFCNYSFEIIFASNVNVTNRIYGSIVDGDAGFAGDRPCSHFDIDGRVWSDPDITFTNVQVSCGKHGSGGTPTILPYGTLLCQGSRRIGFFHIFIVGVNEVVNFPDDYWLGTVDELGRGGVYETRNLTFRSYYDQKGATIECSYQQRYRNASTTGNWVDRFYTWVNRVWPSGRVGSKDYNPKTRHRASSSVTCLESTLTDDDLSRISQLTQHCVSSDMWGDLCQESINDVRAVDINSIAYVGDLVGLAGEIRKVVSLFTTGGFNLKTAANFFLEYQYGLRLTIKDTQELARVCQRQLISSKNYSWVRSADTDTVSVSVAGESFCCNVRYNYKIYYNPRTDRLSNLLSLLSRWDAFPSLENVWDIVPFSFVVDWFFQIDTALARADTRTRASLLSVHSVLKTEKAETRGVPVDRVIKRFGDPYLSNMGGFVTVTHYERSLGTELDLPRFRPNDPRKFVNYAELVAIVVANR